MCTEMERPEGLMMRISGIPSAAGSSDLNGCKNGGRALGMDKNQ